MILCVCVCVCFTKFYYAKNYHCRREFFKFFFQWPLYSILLKVEM